MAVIRREIIEECRVRLIDQRAELFNQIKAFQKEFADRDSRGDEIDQAVGLLAENQLFQAQQRMRQRLFEIEAALARIEKGSFGVCEETFELIEENRLLSLPWTRFSIEGAEILESHQRRLG